LIGAAEAALVVGAVQVAAGLVDRVDQESLDPVPKARSTVVRYGIALFVADPETLRGGTALLIEAADGFHGRDPGREQRALLMAFESCVVADRLMSGVTTAELGERLSVGADLTDGPVSVILRGLGALIRLPYDQAVPLARAAMAQIGRLPEHEMMQMGTAITALTTFLCDIAWRESALDRAATAARNAGALQSLDTLLWLISLTQLTGGTVRRAVESVEEVRGVRRAMGYDSEQVVNPAVIAWTGGPREVVRQIGEGAGAGGFGGVTAVATWSLAVRDLAEGHYRDAYRRLQPQIADPFLQVTPLQYADFVEAAVRSGHEDEAAGVLADMGRRAAVNGSTWYRGVTLRSRALVAPHHEAEGHFRAAIAALTNTGAVIDLARAHLLYGEWLRRARRRRDARHQLTAALEQFDRGGGGIFAERVRAEIEATGAPGGAPAGDQGPDALTAQELSIARQAAAGRTNAEIAGALFISPNTVDYHLRKVFGKLGISSRRQLADRLGPSGPGRDAPTGGR
jgi:DNA-binding CsgD family transcriptional regulator